MSADVAKYELNPNNYSMKDRGLIYHLEGLEPSMSKMTPLNGSTDPIKGVK